MSRKEKENYASSNLIARLKGKKHNNMRVIIMNIIKRKFVMFFPILITILIQNNGPYSKSSINECLIN